RWERGGPRPQSVPRPASRGCSGCALRAGEGARVPSTTGSVQIGTIFCVYAVALLSHRSLSDTLSKPNQLFMTQAVLQTEELSKKYRRRLVVDRLSLTVERGDIFGFLGQNGAGKSTTIRMALGLVRPTSGRVRILGYDMCRQPLRALRRTGAIIEAPAFYENFSGRQNLRMLAAMSGGAEQERIEMVLEIVGLSKRARDPVRVYSHGMRQRLGIAQALLPNP